MIRRSSPPPCNKETGRNSKPQRSTGPLETVEDVINSGRSSGSNLPESECSPPNGAVVVSCFQVSNSSRYGTAQQQLQNFAAVVNYPGDPLSVAFLSAPARVYQGREADHFCFCPCVIFSIARFSAVVSAPAAGTLTSGSTPVPSQLVFEIGLRLSQTALRP